MSDMNEPEKNKAEPPAFTLASPPPSSLSPSPAEPGTEGGRSGTSLLGVVGFLVLLAGLIWLWRHDAGLTRQLAALREQQQAAPAPAIDPARVAALESAVDALRQQVASLQARPKAAPVDLAPLDARVSALEKRPLPAPAPDLKPIEARVAALEQRKPPPPPDLTPIESRIAALEQRKPPPPPDLTPLESRIAAVEQRKPTDLQPLQSQVAALDAKLQDAATKAGVANLAAAQLQTRQQVEAAAAAAQADQGRTVRLQKLQQAQVALAAGQPLGTLPDAPPAVAQFASAPPPTEAALRLSFPQAAHAAEVASRPSTAGLSVWGRMWQHAQALVTVRKGDRVLVGTPSTTTLAAARVRLDAGDLAGAVATLDKLDPKAAQAMAEWKSQAQALLDARAALAAMAAS